METQADFQIGGKDVPDADAARLNAFFDELNSRAPESKDGTYGGYIAWVCNIRRERENMPEFLRDVFGTAADEEADEALADSFPDVSKEQRDADVAAAEALIKEIRDGMDEATNI